MKEIWKPVKGYESLYQVSDSGRVRSLRTGKYISKRVGYDGYVRVSLSNSGGYVWRYTKTLNLLKEAVSALKP